MVFTPSVKCEYLSFFFPFFSFHFVSKSLSICYLFCYLSEYLSICIFSYKYLCKKVILKIAIVVIHLFVCCVDDDA